MSGRWFVDETYVKVSGVWRYVYRAVDATHDEAQVIDVYVSVRRDLVAARRFFTRAITAPGEADEVVTDLAQALETVIEQVAPHALHNTKQYANNRVDCDHGRLKSRLPPMRGPKTDRTAQIVIAGHAFMQNVRRGHRELRAEAEPLLHVAKAFADFSEAISALRRGNGAWAARGPTMQQHRFLRVGADCPSISAFSRNSD